MSKITPEDLVQYIYSETSTQKTEAIKAALENDWSLREAFEQIVSAQNQLKNAKLSPREESIKKILDYAEKGVNHLHPL